MEFVCFVCIIEQTANFALHNIKKMVFITEVERVYCALRTDSLYRVFHNVVQYYKHLL
jgi:hypothetical protein